MPPLAIIGRVVRAALGVGDEADEDLVGGRVAGREGEASGSGAQTAIGGAMRARGAGKMGSWRLRSILAAAVFAAAVARSGSCGDRSRLRRGRQGSGGPAPGVPPGRHDEPSRQRAPAPPTSSRRSSTARGSRTGLRPRQRAREHPGPAARQRHVPPAPPAQPPRRRAGGGGALDRAAVLGEIRDGYVWGRGATDMKGTGHLPARDAAAAQALRRRRSTATCSSSGRPTKRRARRTASRAMVDHYRPDLRDAEYCLTEGNTISVEDGQDGRLGRRRHGEGAALAQDRRHGQGRPRVDPRARRRRGAADPRPGPDPRLRAAGAPDPGRQRVLPAARAHGEGRSRARAGQPARRPRRPRPAQAAAVRPGPQRLPAHDDLGHGAVGQREDQRHSGRRRRPRSTAACCPGRTRTGSSRRCARWRETRSLRWDVEQSEIATESPIDTALFHAIERARNRFSPGVPVLTPPLTSSTDASRLRQIGHGRLRLRAVPALGGRRPQPRGRRAALRRKRPLRPGGHLRDRPRRGRDAGGALGGVALRATRPTRGASSSSRPAGRAARSRSRPASPSAARARCSRRAGSSSRRR